jgi:GH24 family phage-related lysozyme (muramidase)
MQVRMYNIILLSVLLLYLVCGVDAAHCPGGEQPVPPVYPFTCALATTSYSDAVSAPPDCRAEAKEYLVEDEGCLNCLYLDTNSIKTIGIGYCLHCSKDAEAEFSFIGANYKAIDNSKPLPTEPSPANVCCDCSRRPLECLNVTQVDTLFNIKFNDAYNAAIKLVAAVKDIWCTPVAVVVNLMYQFGISEISNKTGDWGPFINYLNNQEWELAAQVIRHCHPAGCSGHGKWKPTRCNTNADRLAKGCSTCTFGGCATSGSKGQCSGGSPGKNYALCQTSSSSSATCCNKTVECENPLAKGIMFNATMQCGSCASTCSTATNGRVACCAPGHPIACPFPGCCETSHPYCCVAQLSCCEAGFPVCCGTNNDGFCCRDGESCSYSPKKACVKNTTSTEGFVLSDVGYMHASG